MAAYIPDQDGFRGLVNSFKNYEGLKEWILHVVQNWVMNTYDRSALRSDFPKTFEHWDEFKDFLRNNYGDWKYQRLSRISAPQMFSNFEKSITPSKRSLKKMSRATPSIEWRNNNNAYINIGSFKAAVNFRGFRGRYERGWWVIHTPKKSQTGLFPRINACLRIITEKFIRDVKPSILEIHGADTKRNEWNRVAYRTYETPGYTFFVIREPNSSRAASDGTTGVAWVRDDLVNSGNIPSEFESPDKPR